MRPMPALVVVPALALLLAGCWSAAPAPPAIPGAQRDAGGLVISERGFGPIGAHTVATLANLRALFPTYRIVPFNDPQLEYDIYQGKQKVGFVVINDDASVFNVHATSNQVRVLDRAWRAGEPFRDARALDHCECWGSNPTCYKAGEHIAVNFDRACLDGDDPHELRALDGLVVQRVIWSVEAFGAAPPPPEPEDVGEPDAP